PAQALERELDLPGAVGERHRELLQRVAPDHAVGLQAMPVLEALDAVDERSLVLVAGRSDEIRRQVAHEPQPLAQRTDSRVRVARRDLRLARRDRREGRYGL